jgi:hypothetical protein
MQSAIYYDTRIFKERVKISWGRDSMLLKDLFESRHHCRHRRKISKYKFLLFSFIFLDTDPHLASVVCDPLSLFRFEIRVVCVWELVYVCACEHKFGVATNHGKF